MRGAFSARGRSAAAGPAPAARGSVTFLQGTALYVGAVLGTGVIALPSLAARAAGPASLLAWVALILLSIPMAATFAALGSRFPDSGGVSTFVRRAFGDRAAAATGWCFYFGIPVGAPAAGIFAGNYVAAAVGGGRGTALLVTAALLAVALVINYFGVRVSGRVQLGLTAVLTTLVVLACLLSIPRLRLAHLLPAAPHGWPAIGAAAGLLIWSFAGWEAITHLAGEFRDPQRDLGRATAAALVIVGVVYLAVAAATILALGPRAGRTAAPLAELLASGLGTGARWVAAVVALILTLGVMNAYLAAGAKLGSALGRDGSLPAWLARGSRRGEVPRRSLFSLIALCAAYLGVVALLGVSVGPLVRLGTASIASVYVLGMAAAVRLLSRDSGARRLAWAALGGAGLLLLAAGPYLLWPLVLVVGAVAFQRRRRIPAAELP